MFDALTVLVVDDEPIQRQIAGRMLHIIGVREVIETDDGAHALSIIGARAGAVDLVICDLEMPKMDGMEFIRRLSEVDAPPGLIINSGHRAEIIESVDRMGRAYGLRVLGSLAKPLTRSVLEPLLVKLTETTDGKIEQPARERSTLDLHRCLAENRFVPYFQPKLRFSDQAVTAAETLIRIEQADGEILPPARFMADVVDQGLITEVTLALFDATLAIVSGWNRSGHHPHISFNLSPESLDDVAFGTQLNHRVKAAGIQPSDITFEVVESEISRDFRSSLENTTRLRMLGFGLSIDDFGTGFSSMEQLGALPFSELKVDQSFVTGICDDPRNQAMVTSTVRMAKDLKLTVVAEGIETDQEAAFVHDAGCDFGQGYWLSRPIGAGAFQEFLVSHGSAA